MSCANRVVTLVVVIACLAAAGTSHAQLFTDRVGNSAQWTIIGDGDAGTVEDVRFGVDYGSLDIFGDGFIVATLPEAPNTTVADAATTGIFVSANNDSIVSTSLFAGIVADGLNVGVGTATPDYVLRFDAYHSVTTGSVEQGPPPSATNYQWAGINLTPAAPTAQNGDIGEYRGPFATGSSGQSLAISGEQGAFDDYEVTIGDATIEDRNEGFTGLATAHIERDFESRGFTGGVTPIAVSNQDAGHLTPLPADPSSFDTGDLTTGRQYWLESFPTATGPVDFDANGTLFTELDKDAIDGGTPSNQWTTHEVFFVDGVWTYLIDGTPVLQVDPTTAGDGTQTATLSGTIGLGFLDGFPSFNIDPEGSNFAIYDNIVVDVASTGDVPDMLQTLFAGGYVIPEPHASLLVSAGLILCARRRWA